MNIAVFFVESSQFGSTPDRDDALAEVLPLAAAPLPAGPKEAPKASAKGKGALPPPPVKGKGAAPPPITMVVE